MVVFFAKEAYSSVTDTTTRYLFVTFRAVSILVWNLTLSTPISNIFVKTWGLPLSYLVLVPFNYCKPVITLGIAYLGIITSVNVVKVGISGNSFIDVFNFN